jgi:type VI secretion system secreted protein Hcp
MAIDAFLKLGDLTGESPVKGYEEQIQLLAWSWGMSQSGTTHMATGGGAGKVNVQDLSFTHYVDSSSAPMIHACCTGKHFEEAVLTLRKAGGEALPYLVITMTDLLITSVSTGASGGEDQQTENVTINFAKFKYSYQPQDKTGGKKGGSIDVEYNIATNE